MSDTFEKLQKRQEREALPTQHSALGATDTYLWHAQPITALCEAAGANPAAGLSRQEVSARLATYGPNRLADVKRESLWEVVFEELREPMILLLLGTGVLYGVLGGLIDALTIFAIILVVIGVEIFNERRAEHALDALRTLAEPNVLVRRAGQAREIPAEQLVPGDVLLLGEGRRVPADARLVESFGLSADESALTGESVPVEKTADAFLSAETPLAERANLVFAGTAITRGRATAVVFGTGRATELGHVADLAAQVREPRTPLQRAMRELTRWMVWLALGFSVVIPLLGWLLAHEPLQQMLLTGFSLAFATIPEELPILITIVLALGAYRLSQQHAIVKRLRAAETLSAVTVIATDKTGTLTENHMAVSRLIPASGERRLLEIGALCNDAIPHDGSFVGDPLEVALLDAAKRAGMDVSQLRRAHPLRAEFPFDAVRKRMSVVYAGDGASDGASEDPLAGLGEPGEHSTSQVAVVAVKGAPENVLARCTSRDQAGQLPPLTPMTPTARRELLAEADRMTGEGLRVIALAEKPLPDRDRAGSPDSQNPLAAALTDAALTQDMIESNLAFVGFVGLADPPRPEVRPAIAACKDAGIRLIMVTGDHPLTAQAIARAVGLDESRDETPDDDQRQHEGQGHAPRHAPRVVTGPDVDRMSDDELRGAVGVATIFARTTPEHKLRIVRALHARGERVAVTGDGINDAPALAAADIGIAMGETGTDVAREAADIVLADDNFATITRAVREGRLLFANLKKAIRFYLAVKVALISATLLPVLLLVPVPFSPVQIILTELFMDVAASATFVSEPAEADLMRRAPRDPREPFMNRAMVMSIFAAAAGLFAAVAAVYLVTWYSGVGLAPARTAAFVTWLLGHVVLALDLRSEREPLVRLGLFTNRLMLLWIAATVAVVLLITFVPFVQVSLKTTSLTGGQWLLALGAALFGTFWMEGYKLVRQGRTV